MRGIEHRRVHDFTTVKAEAPVANDGNVQRLCQGQAALVRDHVDDDLK